MILILRYISSKTIGTEVPCQREFTAYTKRGRCWDAAAHGRSSHYTRDRHVDAAGQTHTKRGWTGTNTSTRSRTATRRRSALPGAFKLVLGMPPPKVAWRRSAEAPGSLVLQLCYHSTRTKPRGMLPLQSTIHVLTPWKRKARCNLADLSPRP